MFRLVDEKSPRMETLKSPNVRLLQTVSCEIKFAHAHVRARSHVCDVRAKRLSKCACDVRACSHFSCVRRAIAISHVFRTFWGKKGLIYDFFGSKDYFLCCSMVLLYLIVLEMELSA